MSTPVSFKPARRHLEPAIAGWLLSLLTVAFWPVPVHWAAYVGAAYVSSALSSAEADPTSPDALSR